MNTPRVRIFQVLGLLAAFAAACGPSVGRPCRSTSDCEPLQTCFTGFPDGFCSKACTTLGSAAECPGGTVCIQSAAAYLCSPLCKAASDCRSGYTCTEVAQSSTRACMSGP
jgi:hypothetical protein